MYILGMYVLVLGPFPGLWVLLRGEPGPRTESLSLSHAQRLAPATLTLCLQPWELQPLLCREA